MTQLLKVYIGRRKAHAMLRRLFAPTITVHAHCDLPCGVYDPAQARLEAESVKACMEKYHASDDPDFKARAISIKEERSNLVKEHLWVLWTDYFKPPHFEKYPQLHTLFNEATKLAGAAEVTGLAQVAAAFVAAERLFGMAGVWQRIEMAEMGEQARAVVLRNQGALARTLSHCLASLEND